MNLRKSVRRVSVALAVAGLVAVGTPAQAGAAPPEPIDVTYEFVTAPDPTDPLSFLPLCSFDLTAQVTGKTKAIPLPSGQFILTAPNQTVTVTNLETEETLTLNINGTTKAQADGSFLYRGAGLILRSVQFGDDINGLVYAHGRFVFDPSAPEGEKLTGTGRSVDICAELA